MCRPSQIRQWLQENSRSPTPAHIYCQRNRQKVSNNWNSGKQAWTRTQVHFATTHSEEDGKRNKKNSKAHCHRIARNGSILGSQSLQNNHQALSTCQRAVWEACTEKTQNHKRKRMEFAKYMTLNWDRVLWSDETKIELFGNKHS